jgi:glycosyltransferase involved in cell wall biosynthesis
VVRALAHLALRVLVVAEYYPRAADPVRGVWAHRQAVAAREAGAEIEVAVLHRPLPPLSAVRRLDRRALAEAVRQPAAASLDGLDIRYLRYLSPPRPLSYGSWGTWAAPALKRALAHAGPFDLIHAHYAVPAGDAVRRAAPLAPLVVSVHGHDVYGTGAGGANVRSTLAHARLVIANSAGTAERCAAAGARATRVVHLGADVPATPPPRPGVPTLVTVAHLVERKRHADVITALARLPELRYVIVGDGPERERLVGLASSLGVGDRVEFAGQLPHDRAVAVAQSASVFVLPSVDEAFGVAYLEAMAGGVPVIGCAGEPGPLEIAAASADAITLVPPRDPDALAAAIDRVLTDPSAGRAARETVARSFTWERCGTETVAAYEQALADRPANTGVL